MGVGGTQRIQGAVAAAVAGGNIKSTQHNIRIEPSSGNLLGKGALDHSSKTERGPLVLLR